MRNKCCCAMCMKMSVEIVRTTVRKPSNIVTTRWTCLKETWTQHSYNVLLSTYISFYCCIYHPTLRHLKREHDLYQNINHHSLYVNKFRISPFTMRTSTRAGNATFPALINHTHWVIWQSTPNTGWGAAIPRAQTHHLMWRNQSGDRSFLMLLACCQPLPTRSVRHNLGK